MQSRSSSLHRLKQIANTIFDLPSGLFSSAQGAAAQRMDNPRVRQLVGLLTRADHLKSIPFPPLLYDDEDTSDIARLFLNPYLIKVRSIFNVGARLRIPFSLDCPRSDLWTSILACNQACSDSKKQSVLWHAEGYSRIDRMVRYHGKVPTDKFSFTPPLI